jgi:hypothetical protein
MSNSDFGRGRSFRGRSRPEHETIDNALLSPPINTWKSPHRKRRHRHTRSHSAPAGPGRRPRLETVPEDTPEEIPALQVLRPPNSFGRPFQQKKSYSSFASIGTTRGGELLPPPPPLCTYTFTHPFTIHSLLEYSAANNILA